MQSQGNRTSTVKKFIYIYINIYIHSFIMMIYTVPLQACQSRPRILDVYSLQGLITSTILDVFGIFFGRKNVANLLRESCELLIQPRLPLQYNIQKRVGHRLLCILIYLSFPSLASRDLTASQLLKTPGLTSQHCYISAQLNAAAALVVAQLNAEAVLVIDSLCY